MPNYNSTARVPFKHGGSVKKPKVKRIILWKGKAKDWPGAKEAARQTRNRKAEGGRIEFKKGSARTERQVAKAEIFKAKAKSKGGETDFDFSGYPQTSKYRKALTKHEKKFPQLVKNIEYDISKLVPKYEEGPHKVKMQKQKRSKKAHGGSIDDKLRKLVKEIKANPLPSKTKSLLKQLKKSYARRKYKKGGEALDRHPPSEKEKRAQRQAEYIKKHGKPEPRRKTLAVTDKYKKIREQRKFSEAGFKPLRIKKAEGGTIGFKKGGRADKKWIQKATKGMRKDKPCTGKKFGSATCPPGSKRYNLAQTFKKMARSKHASGGLVRYI